MKRRTIAATFAAVALSFAVGLLVGKTACSEPKTKIVREYHEVGGRTCPEPKECCPCPEPPPEPDKAKPGKVARVKKPKKPEKPLPGTDDAENALRRKRLLAWVRDRSSTLSKCSQNRAEASRMTVTIQVGESGTFRRVSADSPGNEVPSTTRSCVRNEIKGWVPPKDLVSGKEDLVFGLTL